MNSSKLKRGVIAAASGVAVTGGAWFFAMSPEKMSDQDIESCATALDGYSPNAVSIPEPCMPLVRVFELDEELNRHVIISPEEFTDRANEVRALENSDYRQEAAAVALGGITVGVVFLNSRERSLLS